MAGLAITNGVGACGLTPGGRYHCWQPLVNWELRCCAMLAIPLRLRTLENRRLRCEAATVTDWRSPN